MSFLDEIGFICPKCFSFTEQYKYGDLDHNIMCKNCNFTLVTVPFQDPDYPINNMIPKALRFFRYAEPRLKSYRITFYQHALPTLFKGRTHGFIKMFGLFSPLDRSKYRMLFLNPSYHSGFDISENEMVWFLNFKDASFKISRKFFLDYDISRGFKFLAFLPPTFIRSLYRGRDYYLNLIKRPNVGMQVYFIKLLNASPLMKKYLPDDFAVNLKSGVMGSESWDTDNFTVKEGFDFYIDRIKQSLIDPTLYIEEMDMVSPMRPLIGRRTRIVLNIIEGSERALKIQAIGDEARERFQMDIPSSHINSDINALELLLLIKSAKIRLLRYAWSAEYDKPRIFLPPSGNVYWDMVFSFIRKYRCSSVEKIRFFLGMTPRELDKSQMVLLFRYLISNDLIVRDPKKDEYCITAFGDEFLGMYDDIPEPILEDKIVSFIYSFLLDSDRAYRTRELIDILQVEFPQFFPKGKIKLTSTHLFLLSQMDRYGLIIDREYESIRKAKFHYYFNTEVDRPFIFAPPRDPHGIANIIFSIIKAGDGTTLREIQTKYIDITGGFPERDQWRRIRGFLLTNRLIRWDESLGKYFLDEVGEEFRGLYD